MLTDRGASADVARSGRDEIALELPADSRFLGALRGMARSLAAQGDLTADDVEDVQMAVDEAFVLLVPIAGSGSTKIAINFAITAGQIDVTMSLDTTDTAQFDRSGLSWTVLAALAEELDVTTTEGKAVISFTKRRVPA